MTKQTKSLLQATDDEARIAAKELIHCSRIAALAILDTETGYPIVSRVGGSTDMDGAPIFLMSNLTGRAQALIADNRASLLMGDIVKGDPLAQARMTLIGSAKLLTEADDIERVRRRYLARHPKSKLYIDFKDFGFWRFEAERANFAIGFGKAYALTPNDIMINLDNFKELLASEEDVVTHMNKDHSEAVNLYATKLCGKNEGTWRMTGVDPEGVDLMTNDDACRLCFDSPLNAAEDIGKVLVALAKKARELT
ncbi:MAG: HugZ family protein [Emcibacteraceae bacterium]|nr:HugZ family protein [Emcibacteraceae bacterium]